MCVRVRYVCPRVHAGGGGGCGGGEVVVVVVVVMVPVVFNQVCGAA
jgi:hypothetical protein